MAAAAGSALILSGDAGVGKSALLDFAGAGAAPRGLRVLRGAGTDLGAAHSFLALAQLLLPLRAELDGLPAEYRGVLQGTLGLRRATGEQPNRLLVCNAVLALLVEAAKRRPTLLIVDDLHGLDRASAMVLTFVARAATGTRLGFVGAARADKDDRCGWREFPQRRVEPLGPAVAHSLLRGRFPRLPASLRRRVVEESDGLPLALLEFAAALESEPRDALELVPSVLPLPGRLQSLFAARVAELPDPTRRLLLLAALDGSGDLRVLRAAAESDEVLDHLDAAERARLVEVDEGTGRLTFRPLVRSAVVDGSTSAERRRAHRTLAMASPHDSEQRAFHLGHATVGPDESVAAVVEHSARAILRRGDVSRAVDALIRASQISAEPADRNRRMAEAAYIVAELGGEPDTARCLLEEARRDGADVGAPLRVATATTALLVNGDDGGDLEVATRALIEQIDAAFEHETAGDSAILDALHTLAAVCRFFAHEDACSALGRFVERLGATAPLDLRLRAATLDLHPLDPDLLRELDRAIEGLDDEADPFEIVKLGIASVAADRLPACVPALERVVGEGEAVGAVGCVVHARWLLGCSAFWRGEWDDAQAHFDAGLALCGTLGLGGLRWPGVAGLGLLAAGRGEVGSALACAEEITAWASPRGAKAIAGYASGIVAMKAVSEGDFEAFERRRRRGSAFDRSSAGPLDRGEGGDDGAGGGSRRAVRACAECAGRRVVGVRARVRPVRVRSAPAP